MSQARTLHLKYTFNHFHAPRGSDEKGRPGFCWIRTKARRRPKNRGGRILLIGDEIRLGCILHDGSHVGSACGWVAAVSSLAAGSEVASFISVVLRARDTGKSSLWSTILRERSAVSLYIYGIGDHFRLCLLRTATALLRRGG